MKFTLLTFFIIIGFRVQSISCEKPKFYIIFEGFCVYSKKFITDILAKDYTPILDDYIDIIFIPFGKARQIRGSKMFHCQHGPDECQINKIMACALHFMELNKKNQSSQVELIGCMMSDPLKWMKCVRDMSFDKVDECSNSTLGQNLQIKNHKLQNKVVGGFPQGVPLVMVSYHPNDYESIKYTEVKKTICEYVEPDLNDELAIYCGIENGFANRGSSNFL
uniref:CSON004807 protein n=1 Tax=Culicoides sonorensis TaxID=179676 RepID=A0A336LZ83_CULSO